MYGTEPSVPGRYAIELFSQEGKHDLLELGAGQGRDTFAFVAAGFNVTALDYEAESLRTIYDRVVAVGMDDRLQITPHDVREALPYRDAGFDAVYSHMLFNMALTTSELDALTAEVYRVLRPGGLHLYTVRHVGDAHYGTGVAVGDAMYENGGFVVHFFDRALVDRLSAGFSITEVHEFEEGSLPRRLWRVTLRRDT
jgi:ubiquinone/menaquinone biosynthesis C-methylase UbiE